MKKENLYQRNLMRLKGFCAGAGARPMDPKHIRDADYDRGYLDGQICKHEYSKSSALEYGVQLREIVPL